MTLQDLAEKLRRYPIPSTCGAIVLVCFFAFYLRMSLLTDLEIENDGVQRELQQVEHNVAHGRTLAEHITEMKDRTAALDARIIKTDELANNLRYFYEIEASTRVAIGELRQNVSVPAKGAPKTILAGVDYTVQLSGRFHEIVAYLNELEHGRHFYRLKSFNLQRGRIEPSGANPAPVALSLNLELLAWP